jgi:hypothetical protein
MVMISPSAPPRRWRSTSPSVVESLLTLISDMNLLERVGLDEELFTILQTIGWGKLYDEPHQVLHYSLIGWERHTTASQDHLTLTGELIWR